MCGNRIAAPIALIFFSSFLANEAVFWVSAVGILYCTIFSVTAFFEFTRGRSIRAALWLVPGALSYELWMITPLLFLFCRRIRDLVIPFLMVVLYFGLQFFLVGGGSVSSYGGFSLDAFPFRFSAYIAELFSPMTGAPPVWIAWVLTVLALGMLAFPRYRLPAAIYCSSALLFSLSADVPSRFHYIPSLALISMAVLAMQDPRFLPSILGTCIAGYMAIVSPWINFVDGRDYEAKAALHEQIYSELGSELDRLTVGDSAVLVNRLGPERLVALQSALQGRPKPLFVRGGAIGGMVYPDDLVRIRLAERGSEPTPVECDGQQIEVGRGDVLSYLCFRVDRAADGDPGRVKQVVFGFDVESAGHVTWNPGVPSSNRSSSTTTWKAGTSWGGHLPGR